MDRNKEAHRKRRKQKVGEKKTKKKQWTGVIWKKGQKRKKESQLRITRSYEIYIYECQIIQIDYTKSKTEKINSKQQDLGTNWIFFSRIKGKQLVLTK